MSGSGPAVLATYVSNLKPYFGSQGLDWSAMLADVGISTESLADPDDYIDINAVATLMENAAKTTGDSCFGLHCSEATPMEAVSFLGFLAMNARTTGDAIKVFQRFTKIVVTPIEMSCRVVDGRAFLIRSYADIFSAPRRQFDLYSLALMIRRMRQGAGENWNVDQIEFDHPDPGCPVDCERLLGPRILYNRSQCSIVFNVDTLDRNLRNAEPLVFKVFTKDAEERLEKRPASNDIVELTRHQIAVLLPDGAPELDAVAAVLNVSPRSLQTQLAKEDTSFTKLLDTVRLQKAKSYLLETDLQITMIAYMLGFTEVSALTRASLRWFKRTPSAYRTAYRNSESSAKKGA